MAGVLRFRINGRELEANPVKIDRKKLYGYTQLVATNDAGDECVAASIDADGSLIVPPGGFKIGMIGEDGRWLERSDFVAVNAEGEKLEVMPSSFDGVIDLVNEAGNEEFLDHKWKSVYVLGCPQLAKSVGEKVFSFPFNYRADVNPNDGYLLASGAKVFLFAGEKVVYDYVGMAEQATLDAVEEDDSSDEDLDFTMM